MRRGGLMVAALAVACTLVAGCSSSGRRTIDYVALGDSYPSGDGIGPFDPGTDASFFTDGCRRSAMAYPRVLRVRDTLRVTHAACSRAKVAALSTAQFPGQGPQLDALTRRTGLVTVEIGANDTGAVDMLVSCLVAPGACQLLDSVVDARVAAFTGPLAEELREARRRAPLARILVLGYPQILPEPGAIRGTCARLAVLGVTRAAEAITFVRAKTTEVNSAIRASAQAAGVEFVDVENAFSGHEVCTTDEWVFGLVPEQLRGSFHPTAVGHRALAARIARTVDSAAGSP